MMEQTDGRTDRYTDPAPNTARVNKLTYILAVSKFIYLHTCEWLACWTQAQKGPGSNRSRDAVG